jgi:ATP-dependent protease ClpP protease subunit
MSKHPSDWRFTLAARGEDALEIAIYDVIGKGWDGEGVSADSVLQQLKGSKAKTLHVRINSVGGSAFDGIAIYSLLRDHEARVVVDIDGIAASAASVIAMAGDEIRIADGALMMIHGASTITYGNADDHEAQAAMLRKLNESILSVYAARTSRKTREELEQAMRDETWFTAAEALDWGLVDAVTKAKAVAACGDLSRFRRVPEQLRTMSDQAQTQDVPELQIPVHVEEPAPAPAPTAAVSPDAVALTRIFAETGITNADDVIGAVVAGKSAIGAVAQLEARVAEFEREASQRRRTDAVENAAREGRLTPHMRETFVPALSALSDEAFAAALKALPVAIPRPTAVEPAGAQASGSLPDGRTYDELKPAERAELKRTNPALFESLRASSKQA